MPRPQAQSSNPQVVVREARQATAILGVAREVVRDLLRSRRRVGALVRREISSELGASPLWWVGPATSVVTLTLFATGLRRSGVLTVDPGGLPYPLFVLIGAVVWTAFLDALQAPMRILRREVEFLLETTASPEVLLVASLGPVALRTGVRLVILLLGMIWFRVEPSLSAPAVIFPLALAIATGFALGLLAAPLSFLLRGLDALIDSFSVVLFLMTPVCFPPPGGALGGVMALNPLGALMTIARAWLASGPPGSASSLALVSAAVVPSIVLALALSRIAIPVVLEVAGD